MLDHGWQVEYWPFVGHEQAGELLHVDQGKESIEQLIPLHFGLIYGSWRAFLSV